MSQVLIWVPHCRTAPLMKIIESGSGMLNLLIVNEGVHQSTYIATAYSFLGDFQSYLLYRNLST